jgi:hypothetical protein
MDVDGLGVLNTEAKFDECGTVCEVQYKKNLRINHAIYREADRCGTPCGDAVGYSR